jgi:glycosyltransferase involved in cell wall biosynthesis
MKLSTITIVMDEEQIIDRWMGHYANLFEQVDVVIVDGGSTDKTVEKIKSYGIDTYFREWDHHFSNQRNFAIEKAKYDWCLTLDTDLYLSKEFMDELPIIVETSDAPVLLSYRYNYIDGEKFEHQFEETHFRMFRKSCGARYVGKIHEGLSISPNIPVKLLDKKFYAIHDKPKDRAIKRWEYYRDHFGSTFDANWIEKYK